MAIREELDLGTSPFLNALKRADYGVQKFAAKFQTVLAKFPAIATGVAAAVGIGAAAIAGVGASMKSALDLGGELEDLKAQTGQSATDLLVLQRAFANAGLGAEATGDLVSKLQKTFAGTSLASASTVDQIGAMQQAFAGVADPSERAKLAFDMFGKSGAKMLRIFNDAGALDVAKTQVGGLAGVMERFSPMFDTLGDTISSVFTKVQQFGAGALSQVAPRLTEMFNGFNSLDLTGLGVMMGKILDFGLQLIQVLTPVFKLLKGAADLANKTFPAVKSGGEKGPTAGVLGKAGEALAQPQKKEAFGISSLGKRGLDVFSNRTGGAANPQLDESKKTNKVLEQILNKIAGDKKAGTSIVADAA